ncbi:hypothetical protein SLS62_007327 [Diatrype stigma]|uniref:Uncharacterized protein n=1 Tax=Diatrype stigma TaxID=117547 RepID=A0AAN9UR49_9PEZI
MKLIAQTLTRTATAARWRTLPGSSSLVASTTPSNKHLIAKLGACYSSSAGPSIKGRQSVEGRHAIVTGSARGIGKAIAIRLALDGYNVCVNDIPANEKGCEETVAEIQSIGRKACLAIADVTKRDQVKQMVETSVKTLGPLDTMIANAGIAIVKGVLDVTEEEFNRLFGVNVFGVHNCYAEAAEQMLAQRTASGKGPWSPETDAPIGKIIGAASTAGYKPFPLLGHYSATKWAVRGLTHAYAAELAPRGITVNSFAPGIVGTDMWDLIDARIAEQTGRRRGEVRATSVRTMTALGRVSVADDVARLVSFLASPDSDYITGQTPIVDGGIHYN